jgi:hypothetical protein
VAGRETLSIRWTRSTALQNGVGFDAGQYGQALTGGVDVRRTGKLVHPAVTMMWRSGDSQTAFANIIDNNHTGARAGNTAGMAQPEPVRLGIGGRGSPSPVFDLAPGGSMLP